MLWVAACPCQLATPTVLECALLHATFWPFRQVGHRGRCAAVAPLVAKPDRAHHARPKNVVCQIASISSN
eukprot:6134558-Pyramimonas_sp.AAC.1